VVDWQERSFELYEVGDPAIDKLLTRRVGMHLYYEALQLDRPVARFRELWRILESAFGTTNDRLVNRLADFQTSTELEFTKRELKELLILRGRASHSSSRAGLKELREVTLQVLRRLGRLRCLAEQVILTKKHWGKDSLEVERLGRFARTWPPIIRLHCSITESERSVRAAETTLRHRSRYLQDAVPF